jgi:hypothetical protein
MNNNNSFFGFIFDTFKPLINSLQELKNITFNCQYCNKQFDTENGKNFHEQKYCNKNNICFKCGRNGHYASKCYAKKHIDGTNI